MKNMNSRAKKIVVAAGAALIAGTALSGVTSSAQAATKPDAEELQYLVTEEKLAHDVYVTLGEEYGFRILTNIARSETQHQSAIENPLDKYGIKNPTLNDKVGVLVEETDIADLKKVIAGNKPAAVDRVMNRLLDTSYNHLAAFERQLR